MTTAPPPHPSRDHHWLAAVLAAADTPLIGTTIDGTVVVWNDAARRVLGYTLRETIGRPRSLLTASDEGNDIRVLLEEISARPMGDQRQVAWRAKGGSVMRLAVAAYAVRTGLGQQTGILESVQVPGIAARRTKTDNATYDWRHSQHIEWPPRPPSTALRQIVELVHELSQPMTAIAAYLQGARLLLNRGVPSDLATAEDAIGLALAQLSRASEIRRRLRRSAAETFDADE